MSDIPQNSQTDSSNQKLEEKLDGMHDTLKSIHQSLDKNNLEKDPNNKISRMALTGTIAWTGLRIGSSLGAKVGLLFNAAKIASGYLKNQKRPDLTELVVNSTAFGMIGAGIGGAIGGIVIGLLGYFGGKKLKDPDQLIKNPLGAIGVMFSPDKPSAEEPHQPPESRNWQADTQKRNPEYAAQATEDKQNHTINTRL